METIFRKVSISKSPEEGSVVFAIDKEHKRILCVFEDGKFYRRTDNSGNDRLIRFYYPDITHWLEEIELPKSIEIATGCREHLKNASIGENKQLISLDWNSGVKWLQDWLLKK